MEKSLVLKKKNALEKRRKTTATVGGTPEDIYNDVMESKFRNCFSQCTSRSLDPIVHVNTVGLTNVFSVVMQGGPDHRSVFRLSETRL